MWSKEMNIKIVRLSGTIIEPANKWGEALFVIISLLCIIFESKANRVFFSVLLMCVYLMCHVNKAHEN